jgi:hypothetical protein
MEFRSETHPSSPEAKIALFRALVRGRVECDDARGAVDWTARSI